MKNITVRAALHTSPDASGKHSIMICIRVNGRRIYQKTGFKTALKDWDGTGVRKGVHNFQRINDKIRQKLNDVEAAILDTDLKKEPVTATVVRRLLNGSAGSHDFFSFAADLEHYLKTKYSPETLAIYKNEIRRIKKFSPSLSFSDINHNFLRRYEGWLISDQHLSGNSVHKAWKILKKVINAAIREKKASEYPFTGFDNPKYRQTDRTYLLSDEVEKIETALLKPMDEAVRIAANYFLLGCYGGLRVSDWQRFGPAFIQFDRIILRAKKNGELVSLQMYPKLRAVVDRLLLLPPCKNEQETNDLLKGVGKLAGLSKVLTSHVARHSFAVRCAERDIPPAVTAEFMGITVKTVMVYYKITNRKIDAEFARLE